MMTLLLLLLLLLLKLISGNVLGFCMNLRHVSKVLIANRQLQLQQ
jgi:uncharacterized protein YneF (UPF0154 family)